MRAAGASALGALGDPDPLRAVQLQVQCSNDDESIVSLLPERSSRWFFADLPNRSSRSVQVPVTTITANASATHTADTSGTTVAGTTAVTSGTTCARRLTAPHEAQRQG